MRPRRGEVWWGEEPDRKRRPHLILTGDSAIGLLHEVRDGMPVLCAANLDNLTMMPLGQLTERVCDLSPERMSEVCAALDSATEC